VLVSAGRVSTVIRKKSDDRPILQPVADAEGNQAVSVESVVAPGRAFLSILRRHPPCRNAVLETIEPLPASATMLG